MKLEWKIEILWWSNEFDPYFKRSRKCTKALQRYEINPRWNLCVWQERSWMWNWWWTLSDWTSALIKVIFDYKSSTLIMLIIVIIVILIMTIEIIWRMMISMYYNWAEHCWLSEQSVARNHKSIRKKQRRRKAYYQKRANTLIRVGGWFQDWSLSSLK